MPPYKPVGICFVGRGFTPRQTLCMARKSEGGLTDDMNDTVEIHCDCTKCVIAEKICRLENGKGPAWCPTKKENESLKEALEEYGDEDVKEFARMASVQEGSCYTRRDAKPFVMIPTKSRLEELIEFSKRMGYKRLGMAFCGGLTYEASLLSEVLEKQGFEVVAVSCKVGGVPKERIGVKDDDVGKMLESFYKAQSQKGKGN